MQTIWLGPTDYVTGDPSLQITYPSSHHPSTVVTSRTTGDFKWISMSLRLPENVTIEELVINYRVSSAQSFISQVRLSEIATPDQALVRYDDPTDLQGTTSTRYRSLVGGIVPTPGAAVILELRLNFQNSADEIFLGAVGVVLSERGGWSVQGKQWFSLSGQAVNVKEFGAVGDGLTDDLPAFTAALDAMTRLPHHAGTTLFIPPGNYRLSDTLKIRRSCVLHGSGTTYNAATVLFFDAGKHGIELIRLDSNPLEGNAMSTEIRNIAIRAVGKTTEAHGILAHARFHLENVEITGFAGDGIHAEGRVSPDGTDVSLWYICRCSVGGCGGHGLFLDGPDANAGVAIALDCRDNVGWGINDSSFLGNTYIACVTHNNQAGPYRSIDTGNQRSLFLGCYSEQDQPHSQVEHPSMVVGGLHAAGIADNRNCFQMTGETYHTITSFETPVIVDTAAGARTAYVGHGLGENNFLGFRRPGTHEPSLLFRYTNPTNPYFAYQGEWAGFNWARLDGGWSFMVPLDARDTKIRASYDAATKVSVDKQAGAAPAFPQGGFRWGGSFNWFGYWNEGGPPVSGIWEETDVLLNRLANYSGLPWSGWIGAMCISGGTAGTYTEGRTATADDTNVLTLDNPSNVLTVGDFIIVNGAAARIASINGVIVKVTQNIPVGAALSMSYRNPVWRRFGALE